MKIAIITSPFCELPPDAIGAVERRWANTAAEFAKHGHSVELLGKKGRTILPSEERLCRTYVRGYQRTSSVYMDIILDFFYSLRALWRVGISDILVCNTFWTPILGPLLFRRKYGKLVYNVARFPRRHLRLYKSVDLFECTSTPVKDELLRICPEYKEKTKVTPNPINVDVYNPSRWNRADTTMRIGYHGRIHREKGLDLLATAVSGLARQFPEIKLRLIGSWEIARGGSGDEHKNLLDKLSGGRIEWVGALSDPCKIVNCLGPCRIYCYPSVAEKGETFGVSPLEAMGLGMPTVVSALKCFADYVEADKNAIVFNHHSKDCVQELSDKIAQLLNDEPLQMRLSTHAADTARQYSTAEIACRYLQDFDLLLREVDA